VKPLNQRQTIRGKDYLIQPFISSKRNGSTMCISFSKLRLRKHRHVLAACNNAGTQMIPSHNTSSHSSRILERSLRQIESAQYPAAAVSILAVKDWTHTFDLFPV
jgi:hypothetical protein